MKRLLVLLALAPLFSFSQQNETGRINGDSLILTNGATFVVGQKLKLAYGSGANKTFEFIHLSPWSIAGPVKLKSEWANHEMLIKGFKFEGTKKIGKVFYIILGGGNLSPYWCDISAAIDNGEVAVIGLNDSKSAPIATSAASPTDELKKLKDLYDGGAITKDEYDSAKKKILSKM